MFPRQIKPRMDIFKHFQESVLTQDTALSEDVNNFATWLKSPGQTTPNPQLLDDTLIRTYLLDLHLNQNHPIPLKRVIHSLQVFFRWLLSQGMLQSDPFENSRIVPATIAEVQAQKKHSLFSGTAQKQELARLQALNHLSEIASQTPEVQPMLEHSLLTLLKVLPLKTAWIALRADASLLEIPPEDVPAHGFVLGAACNLPPALQESNRHALTCPPECTCQRMVRARHLSRAINIFECSRLRDATLNGADGQNLIFHASVPLKLNNQLIGVINFATEDYLMFTAEDLQFFTKAAQLLGIALERAQLYEQAKKNHARLEQELLMARRMQTSLLPQSLPSIPGFGLAASWVPANETSGDYYNIFSLGKNRFAFVLADVCGKGAPAALCMTMIHSLICERVEWLSPAEMLGEVNRRFFQLSDGANFITCIYAILDASTAEMVYAIAGHEPPLLICQTGQMKQVPGSGSALGIFADAVYSELALGFQPGDCLLLFTDGVTEAMDRCGSLYTLQRVKQALAGHQHQAGSLLNALQKDIHNWVGSPIPGDDTTMLVIGRNPC